MTLFALGLVLLSAVTHASWNLLAKRASGGPPFNWLFDALTVLLWAPITAVQVLADPPRLGPTELGFMLGSGLLHLGYFLLLGQGYRVGDLSLVYPLARGTGPVLSTLVAVAVLGEHPSGLALAGAASIGVGVFVLTGDPRRLRGQRAGRSVVFALLTGVLIAAYTLWDKQAVSAVHIAPLVYFWGLTTARALLLTPVGVTRWPTVRLEWTLHRREAFGIAILSGLSYVLVLIALSVTPVSYVAPTREIGILIGALMGSRWLAEGDASRRLAGAGAMVVGVVALAVG
jgi:drug/metabolite transporter (DMT)-like permease